MTEKYPASVEFEVDSHVIAAASANHDRDNPLALALTDRLETRYHVFSNASGSLIAAPYDDQSEELAAGEDAPHYHLRGDALAFYEAFNAGNVDIVNYHDTWFTATIIKGE